MYSKMYVGLLISHMLHNVIMPDRYNLVERHESRQIASIVT